MSNTDIIKEERNRRSKSEGIDWIIRQPRRWVLSRFLNVFNTPGKGPQVESFISRRRISLDDVDFALLHALSIRDGLTAEELAEDVHLIPVDEVTCRLERYATIALVFPEGDEPPVWLSVERAGRQTPFIDFVEITNHCPSSCIMCRAAQGFMQRPRGFMKMNLFEKIIGMIEPRTHLKPLILHNAGEPLMHPDLVDMVSLAYGNGIPTEISTNAGLLTFEVYEKIRDAGISRIVIALDGTDYETLCAIRGKGAYPQRAFENIDAILNDRAENRCGKPAIVLQMVQMQANAHQHDLFRERYGSLGLPGVSIFLKPVEAPANSPLFMPGAVPPQFFCMAPWQTLGIYWDGSVVPCCYDLNASLCLGNVNDQTLAEIWNGTALSDLRERIVNDRCLKGELCAICHHRPDRYLQPDVTTIREFPDDWH